MSSPEDKSPEHRTSEVTAPRSSLGTMRTQRRSKTIDTGIPTRGSSGVKKGQRPIDDSLTSSETSEPASKNGARRAADEGPVSSTSAGTAAKFSPNRITGPEKLVQATLVEKRKKAWLSEAPIEHSVRLANIAGKRLFIVGYRVIEGTNAPEFQFDFRGGGVYKTTITEIPLCSCPDALFRGNMCKHIIYVLIYALKVPDDLRHQQAFVPSELRNMRESLSSSLRMKTPIPGGDGTPKPFGDDCPVCLKEVTVDDDIVSCKRSCGSHIHKTCHGAWLVASGDLTLRCFYCHAHWKDRINEVSSPSKS